MFNSVDNQNLVSIVFICKDRMETIFCYNNNKTMLLQKFWKKHRKIILENPIAIHAIVIYK